MKYLIANLLVLTSLASQAQSLQDSINKINPEAQGRVGSFLLDLEAHDSCAVNAADHYPMLSVFKFPLALYILDQVDKGKLDLEAPIDIRKKEWERMFSPLLNSHKEKHFTLSLREVLIATVGASDNVGCDLLFRLVGGPSVVNDYVHQLNIKNINIAKTEVQMAAGWDAQYENWCTPPAMGQLLTLFYTGKLLSPASTQLLLKWMTESTSPRRLQNLLPQGTTVAHKTGTSNTNPAGITAATNDVGIITLPNGHHLIAVVYVADAKADQPTREGVISKIARAGYMYYTEKK
ncbi:MAG: class A beta-lactamase [Bacteroidetes bacterium]|nr:class A beta-lactamase [Bacteroidota bacterium]